MEGGSSGPCSQVSSLVHSLPFLLAKADVAFEYIIIIIIIIITITTACLHVDLLWQTGNSLAVQWLRFGAFTTTDWVRSLVRELRSRMPHIAAKKKDNLTNSTSAPILCWTLPRNTKTNKTSRRATYIDNLYVQESAVIESTSYQGMEKGVLN